MKDWTEATSDLMQSYAEAQRRLWESWAQAAYSAVPGASGGESGEGEGAAARSSSWLRWPAQWQEMAEATMRMWTSDSPKVSKEVADRLFVGEEAFFRFLELTFEAMQSVAPRMESGEDWVELLRRYVDQLKEQMAQGGVPGWLKDTDAVTESLPDLWATYVEELERISGPWMRSLQNVPFDMMQTAKGDTEAARRVNNAFMDTYMATFGRYLSAPAVGYTREFHEKATRGFEAWVEYQRAQSDYQTELLDTGFDAFETLLGELVERGEEEKEVGSLRELFNLWVDTAEKAYFELFSSDAFAEVQGRLVNASMLFQTRQREIQEEMLDLTGLPTRSEADQIHKHVYDLRVELRYLKREVEALRKASDGAGGVSQSGEKAAGSGEKATKPEPEKPQANKSQGKKSGAKKSQGKKSGGESAESTSSTQ